MTGFPVVVPFVDHLGARLLSCADGSAHTQLDLAPHHCNSFGVAHGGVLMTLLDVTMAMAGRSRTHHAGDEQMGLVTIEMKTTFMQPAQGARIASQGRCVFRTRTMAFCEAEIVDEGGRTVARASGTFKYVRQR
ncbi:MAG: PaaI family thioesterase [Burkholderiaceae bacterium]|nr:PaaI family thioesterase [Burkholderiaceae bacterium]